MKNKNLPLVVFSVLFLLPTVIFAADFSDVSSDNRAKVAIDYLVNKGCINGYADGSFKPEKAVSRVETLKIVLACLQLPKLSQSGELTFNPGDLLKLGSETLTIPNSETKLAYTKYFKFPDPKEDEKLKFSDINFGAWYVPYLQESLHRELVKGYADGTIRPDQQVSLAELLTILVRGAEIKKTDYKVDLAVLPDYIDKNAWYAKGIAFGLQEKLIGIEEGKRLAPFYSLNRSEAVIIVYNYLVLSDKTASSPQPADTVATTPTESASTNLVSSEIANFKESGVASYYGRGVDGVKTASGENLDVDAYQAAHRTLPFNTIVKITNVDNGKWVKARIIDRGPNLEGRIVDLTPAAFEAIADLSAGLAKVELEVDSSNNS